MLGNYSILKAANRARPPKTQQVSLQIEAPIDPFPRGARCAAPELPVPGDKPDMNPPRRGK